MVKVLVEFPYDADQPDELTIKKGDIVESVVKMEGGWWKGTLHGKTGMFPDNFVKEIDDIPPKPAPANPGVTSGGVVKGLSAKIADQIKVGPPPPGGKPKPPAANGPKKAVVQFDYTPEMPDELGLREGEIIEILNQEEEGWWEGRLRGKTGMLPSNFVKIVDEPVNNITRENEVGKSGVSAGGRRPLADPATSVSPQLSGSLEKTRNPSIPTQPLPPGPLPLPPRKRGRRARVIYSYNAANLDELDLKEGEVITVLDQNLEDPGWWKGEINGKTGVFPDNFVELLEDKDDVAIVANVAPIRPKKKPIPDPTTVVEQTEPPFPPRPVKPTPDAHVVNHKPEVVDKPLQGSIIKPQAETVKTVKTPAMTPAVDEQDDLDGLTREPVLAYPARVKNPSKRPPSLHRQSFNAEPDTNFTQPMRTEISIKPEPTKPIAHVDEKLVAELRKDLELMRANSVSKEQYEALQKELKTTRDTLDTFKVEFNKKLIDLMKEIDDERKLQRTNQVELDRIRRIAENNYISK